MGDELPRPGILRADRGCRDEFACGSVGGEQRFDLTAQFFVIAASAVEKLPSLAAVQFGDVVIEAGNFLPQFRRHTSRFSSRNSQARATDQSRRTVRDETSRASAICSS